VLQIRADQQILQQVERRRVEPLQIVEEERQRMFRTGEDADETAGTRVGNGLAPAADQPPGPAAGHR
jgi:hypothetical protein